jgi:D-beta-D-heptose 7-phosphate kinase/D-beta-D-heptose 1-phosphate adenosyltransferase
MHRLMERLEQLGQPRVALVGDFILDRYVYGHVERINPEAPVPVLRTTRSESRVGGAGNVAAAAAALGCRISCLGVLGSDPTGGELTDLLTRAGADCSPMLVDPSRPTALKTRYVGLAQHRRAQQMIRIDDESTACLADALREQLAGRLKQLLPDVQALAVEDYNKGLLSDDSTPQLIALARRAEVPVTVDPACIDDYSRYRGATVLTPNRYEASIASGVEIDGDESLDRAGQILLDAAKAQAVVITLDREGAYLVTRDGSMSFPHARPRNVYEVSGAGDVVLAVITLALAEGCPLEQAVPLANVAGGLEVERFGFVPVTRPEMLEELGRMVGLRGSKVLAPDVLAGELKRRRDDGETVVLTNGCFDLLHVGHVRFLQQARELGSLLVVAINSDESVARVKGPGRPVLDQHQRAEVLAAMECVDYVTVFDEDTPEAIIRALSPDVLVKGSATDVVVGREIVESRGGKVVVTPPTEGVSTTEIITRISSHSG